MVRKTVVATLIVLVFGVLNNVVSYTQPPKIAQVVYITLSKACSCTLELCQAGDIIVGNVFTGEKKELLKRIDYSTEKEAAKVYLKKYGITQAPAIIFLDARGTLLWMAMGELSESAIQKQLRFFGG
jgi:hypothetical protein